MRSAVAVVGVALLATACGTSKPRSQAQDSSPVTVPGSVLRGAGAFLGPVHQIAVNGIRIGYRQFGRGPELLMVTGDTAPMSLWTPDLLGQLANHFHVTIFDNRGVGYSTDNTSVKMTVPLMASDTADLSRALDLRSPTLVGWSMGGEIGLTVAAEHPGVLGALVTTGADTGSPHAVPPAPGIIAEVNNPKVSITTLLNLIFPPTADAAKIAFGEQVAMIPQETVSATTLARQATAEEEWYHYDRTWNDLPKVKIPVVATNGAQDVLNPPANAGIIAGRIPGGRPDLFAGAGHAMLFQDSAAFVTLVVATASR